MTTYYFPDGDDFQEIRIARVKGDLQVTAGDKTHTLNLQPLGNNRYSCLVNGRSLVFSALRDGQRVRLLMDHRRYSLDILNKRQKIEAELFGSGASDEAEGEIRAPMPGMVLRIEVTAGQEVTPGQPLIVVEAMKMENEIRSTTAGVVAEIAVAPQQAVEKDDLLIVIDSD